jgi:hypothetical protein
MFPIAALFGKGAMGGKAGGLGGLGGKAGGTPKFNASEVAGNMAANNLSRGTHMGGNYSQLAMFANKDMSQPDMGGMMSLMGAANNMNPFQGHQGRPVQPMQFQMHPILMHIMQRAGMG